MRLILHGTLLVPLLVALSGPCSAQTWQVDSLEDAHDALPGDGRCADDQDRCTLRAAIEEAEASGGGTVELLSGRHVLELGALSATESVLVRGQGMDRSTIDANGLPVAVDLTADYFRRFHLVDLQISGASDAGLVGRTCDYDQPFEGIVPLKRVRMTGNAIGSRNPPCMLNCELVGNSQAGMELAAYWVHYETLLIENNPVGLTGSVTELKLETVTIRGGLRLIDDWQGAPGIMLDLRHSYVDSLESLKGHPATYETEVALRSSTVDFLDAGGGSIVDSTVMSLGRGSHYGGRSLVCGPGYRDLIHGEGHCPLDAQLGPLQDNGGPTPTRAPMPGSSAIDAVETSQRSTDQRGFPRVIDGDGDGVARQDRGAVEYRPDRDGDGVPDDLDCMPDDPTITGPLVLKLQRRLADIELTWQGIDSPLQPFRLARGRLDQLWSEQALAADCLGETSASAHVDPATSGSLYYLVHSDAVCQRGWGEDSLANQRPDCR